MIEGTGIEVKNVRTGIPHQLQMIIRAKLNICGSVQIIKMSHTIDKWRISGKSEKPVWIGTPSANKKAALFIFTQRPFQIEPGRSVAQEPQVAVGLQRGDNQGQDEGSDVCRLNVGWDAKNPGKKPASSRLYKD